MDARQKQDYWINRKRGDIACILFILGACLLIPLGILSEKDVHLIEVPRVLFLILGAEIAGAVVLFGFAINTDAKYHCQKCKHGFRWHEDKQGNQFERCKGKNCICSSFMDKLPAQ